LLVMSRARRRRAANGLPLGGWRRRTSTKRNRLDRAFDAVELSGACARRCAPAFDARRGRRTSLRVRLLDGMPPRSNSPPRGSVLAAEIQRELRVDHCSNAMGGA
jgi:hypothetical protein